MGCYLHHGAYHWEVDLKFIKLNEVYKNGSVEKVILNVNNILSVKKSDKGRDTHVLMKDTKFFFVRETVDMIWGCL